MTLPKLDRLAAKGLITRINLIRDDEGRWQASANRGNSVSVWSVEIKDAPSAALTAVLRNFDEPRPDTWDDLI